MSGNAVLIGPTVEECLKVAAVILLIERRPFWIRSRTQLYVMTLGAAVLFAMADWGFNPMALMAGKAAWNYYRLAAVLGVHLIATGVATSGLATVWQRTRDQRRRAELAPGIATLMVGIIIHALYNIIFLVWGMTGMVC
jgi:hypothetical protein